MNKKTHNSKPKRKTKTSQNSSQPRAIQFHQCISKSGHDLLKRKNEEKGKEIRDGIRQHNTRMQSDAIVNRLPKPSMNKRPAPSRSEKKKSADRYIIGRCDNHLADDSHGYQIRTLTQQGI